MALLLTLASAAVSGSPQEGISLNGEWTMSLHGRFWKTIRVPSTYLPVGGATLERTFTAKPPGPSSRALLRFDGIMMTGRVFLNGQLLGEHGPYCPRREGNG